MPELPEVETIVADLAPRLAGRVVEGVAIEWPGSIGEPEPDQFVALMSGRKIQSVDRRGKNIVIHLSGGLVLLVHLRMTGRLILRAQNEPAERFQRVALRLAPSGELRFADARKFGRLRLLPAAELAKLDRRLGPEPLSDELTQANFCRLLGRRRARLKPLLLDQAFLAGVGNIYADEALFVAGIHPHRTAADLSPEECARLFDALRSVLRHAVADRGTSMSDYLDGFGRRGGHQNQLSVYRRTGQPCTRCGTPIVRLRFGGRGTHYCPKCQPTAQAQSTDPVSQTGSVWVGVTTQNPG